ncbi:hypothetical protein G5V59_21560 [Nocardioides sp. W3-2-3]|uniref:hypothetical protein n=1 Tax=Nocardioides convexus TaxID=2712224 RepID=UPI002418418F|nr:hypothetical protein [Nocardioides convexus]NHA01510.1 hypothetical protein [Nocardioides convexus]
MRLDAEDLDGSLRRSHTSAVVEGDDEEPEPSAPAVHDAPADLLAADDPDNIAARVGSRTGPAPEVDHDDVDWEAVLRLGRGARRGRRARGRARDAGGARRAGRLRRGARARARGRRRGGGGGGR